VNFQFPISNFQFSILRAKRGLVPAIAALRTLLLPALVLLAGGGWASGQGAGLPGLQPAASTHRVYSHLLEPREHPDYERRAIKPPSWETFKNRTQFTSLRGFDVQADRVAGFAAELEKFTRTYKLGDVIWPAYPILFAKNLSELAAEIKRRDLYLFDVWGYVPGSGPGGYWQQFKPPVESFSLLESILGERWLGTDIGEQDGRYIGGYASQMTPPSAGRFEQYLNFQRFFQRMSDDLGHKHAALVSLNFGHYLLKEGTFTLIGAETAQGLPNSQVYYAFIRGAGKQYGVPWFGNASIYNRWGFKTYGRAGRGDGYDFGPTKGTSLSLLKRLLYSHLLYNSVAVGFENGWFEGDKLSPIGLIQQSAQRWVAEQGQPGVMHASVALLLDFYSGWTFPRHLYSGDLYRVWGNLPYQAGDFLTDALLDLLYPGYEDSSYFHDESGFLAPTPYGDMADCLLSDAPLWLLNRYAVLILAGELSGGLELRDKLLAYAQAGGHLVITAGNLAKLPGGLAGRTNAGENLTCNCGAGLVTFFSAPFGVKLEPPPSRPLLSQTDQPLAKPYIFDPSMRHALEDILRSQQLFEVQGQGLSFITCRRRPGQFTIGIANNTWRDQPFRLGSLCGELQDLHELPLDQSEKGAPGYAPENVEVSRLGPSVQGTVAAGATGVIAAGDVRLFSVTVTEKDLREIPHLPPPARPRGRLLPLRNPASIQEQILARPTFFEHYDGVCVDWRCLHDHEKAALQQESLWLERQAVRIVVDLSSGIDLYPTLRLMNNVPEDYESSLAAIRDVMDKMELLHAPDLILCLHRQPENNFTDQQSRAALAATLKTLAGWAAARHITLCLRLASAKPPRTVAEALEWLDRVGAPNLKLALSTALPDPGSLPAQVRTRLKTAVGLWLVDGPRRDLSHDSRNDRAPIHPDSTTGSLAQSLALCPTAPLLLDGLYPTQDDEYQAVTALP